MAEFQEVMRQWVRARKATKCRGEENNILSCYPLEAYDSRLIANIEENVMSWAAEHPEPVYPTWAEWLMEHGLIYACNSPYMKRWFVINQSGIEKPIPADVAEKLGIEPKGG